MTRLLEQVHLGERDAADLLPVLYAELRQLAAARLAREAPGNTLQATALVHEAYLRLLGPDGAALRWDNCAHFFGAAAEAMRRILIDHARARHALKRGGAPSDADTAHHARRDAMLSQASLDAAISLDADPALLLDLDDALVALEALDASKAQLVKLRFYAGLTLEQAGRALGIAPATADRHWAFAKAWLFVRLSEGGSRSEGSPNQRDEKQSSP